MTAGDQRRTDLLDRGIGLVQRDGPAPAFTDLSLNRIAERAGVSRATAARSVRSLSRLQRLALATAAHRDPGGEEVWAMWQMASRSFADAPDGTHELLATYLRWHEPRPGELPRTGLWAHVAVTPVGDELRHLSHVHRGVLSLLLAQRLEVTGMAPLPGVTLSGMLGVLMAYASGVAAMGSVLDPVDPLSWATATVADLWQALRRPGAAPEPPGAPLDPSRPPPLASDAELQLARAAVELLAERGLPGPFDHLSVRRVAELGRTSPALLYRHWDTVEAYRAELLVTFVDRANGLLARDLAAARSTAAVVAAVQRWVRGPALVPVLLGDATPRPGRVPVSGPALRLAADRIDQALIATGVARAGEVGAGRDLLCLAVGAEVLERVDPALVRWTDTGVSPPLLDLAARLRLWWCDDRRRSRDD